ncbi:MAG: 1-acyl-sn-glycerol-3-phosphate acyltransferase [Rhodospirillales bacterium]|nr:1-acyl-sn-glycerol-3-phosphate acyltransferase [Rhodospirillales bacterium]
MTILRSALFFAAAILWSAVLAIAFLPLLIMPRRWVHKATRFWLCGILALVAAICGLRYRVAGAENLPAGAAIVASKHQSAWDTFVFHQVLDDPVYVMKRELFRIPLIGWYMRKVGSIGIDRNARVHALKMIALDAKRALASGRQIVIFPEGTRVAPGDERPYRAGIAALYEAASVPVVPVALNSGIFWGRRSFRKHPGLITLAFLPPIAPGLDRRTFASTLRARIEAESRRLAAEAEAQLAPHGQAGTHPAPRPVDSEDKVKPSR